MSHLNTDSVFFFIIDVICQTRVTVFHRNIQTLRGELKIYNVPWSIFNEFQGVWMADETLSLVFDISSHSKKKH